VSSRAELARQCAARRNERATWWRKLTAGRQALLVVGYLRKGETYPTSPAGSGSGSARRCTATSVRPRVAVPTRGRDDQKRSTATARGVDRTRSCFRDDSLWRPGSQHPDLSSLTSPASCSRSCSRPRRSPARQPKRRRKSWWGLGVGGEDCSVPDGRAAVVQRAAGGGPPKRSTCHSHKSFGPCEVGV